jgi:helix-turn-helix protein
MLNKSDWKEMKQHAFDAFARDGSMSVSELENIVDIALADGEFDEKEKDVLVNIISNLTSAEMTDAMWLKVDELIHKFDLNGDSDAFIEHLDEEHEF